MLYLAYTLQIPQKTRDRLFGWNPLRDTSNVVAHRPSTNIYRIKLNYLCLLNVIGTFLY